MRTFLALVVAFGVCSAISAQSPFGVSSSASAFRDHAEWFPQMAAAGVKTVRLFPEWRSIEPQKGQFKWDDTDLLVKNAAANKLEINAVLMGSPPDAKAIHAFPMERLDDWSAWVSAVAARYRGKIRYWEVWNEGNAGFNDGKHTTKDYAKLVAATYAAVKKADPEAKVGLSVASYDAAYLYQTMVALKESGKPGSFDFLAVHPYEIADGLDQPDGEIPFLWMTQMLRTALKAAAPERADAEIWITETGCRLHRRGERQVSEEEAARSLVKQYVMAIAQGIRCVQWFEARDPQGEDAGFGLLSRAGEPRKSYTALKTLAETLGPNPRAIGWVALGKEKRGYGFLFQGKSAPVLVAWMPRGRKDNVDTTGESLLDATTGKPLPVGDGFAFTDAPILVVNPPGGLVQEAEANAKKPFPWGGDYSTAKAVKCRPGSPEEFGGVFVTNHEAPRVTFADGSTGVVMRGDIGHPLSFWVHPTFAGLLTKEYYIRAKVRRLAAGNVGMNLLYEVADSQGGAAYKNTGVWGGTTDKFGWQTITWHVKDACFAKLWGNDFTLRPERSVPFVMGEVEVSTEPLP